MVRDGSGAIKRKHSAYQVVKLLKRMLLSAARDVTAADVVAAAEREAEEADDDANGLKAKQAALNGDAYGLKKLEPLEAKKGRNVNAKGEDEARLVTLLLQYVLQHRDVVALSQTEGFVLSLASSHVDEKVRARVQQAVFEFFSARVEEIILDENDYEFVLMHVFVAKMAVAFFPTSDRRHPIISPLFL